MGVFAARKSSGCCFDLLYVYHGHVSCKLNIDQKGLGRQRRTGLNILSKASDPKGNFSFYAYRSSSSSSSSSSSISSSSSSSNNKK